jgi:uncharacterized protein involved in exopolysaccharide biosynthesis
MEGDYQLHDYFRELLTHWRAVLISSIGALALATTIFFLLPTRYEATALVSLAPARYSLILDEVKQEPLTVQLRSYTDVALSDVVLDEVLQSLGGEPGMPNTLADFRRDLRATTSIDQNIVRLTVVSEDGVRAAAIANRWAQAFAERAWQLYGLGTTDLDRYHQELQATSDALSLAETNLIAAQTANLSEVLQTQLDAQHNILADSLHREYELGLLVQDARDLATRLSKRESTAPADPIEEAALVLISARAITLERLQLVTSGTITRSASPDSVQGQVQRQITSRDSAIQVQISVASSGPNRTIADQLSAAEALATTLEERVAAARRWENELQPRILDLQSQLARARLEIDELVRARDLAESQFRALDNKVHEAELAVSEAQSLAQVASAATPPTETVYPPLGLVAGGAAAAGFGVAATWFVLAAWWRSESRQSLQPHGKPN